MTAELSIATATAALQVRPVQAPQAMKGASDAAMHKAATDFEAVFLSEMMAIPSIAPW